ncbi:MAG: hypothetical protein ACUVRL_02615 [Candidatus Saccharicenans sp.]|uniref:hypothetical protein n=1 Tax=Candidatus Saccharicenans sp. TaxID=2819258 RepID=UPI004049301B
MKRKRKMKRELIEINSDNDNCVRNARFFCFESGSNLKSRFYLIFIGLFFLFLALLPAKAGQLRLEWSPQVSRQWVGPDFYAHRLEDWRLNRGEIECLSPAANRYLCLLTGEAAGDSGVLQVVLHVSVPKLPSRPRARNYVGLRLGLKSPAGDYREAALGSQGLEIGLTTEGLLFIGELESVSSQEKLEALKKALRDGVELRLGLSAAGGQSSLKLSVVEKATGQVLDELEDLHLPAEKTEGGLALVSSLPEVRVGPREAVSRWGQLRLEGNLFQNRPERALGPVAFTLYTLSRGTLRLSAQLVPGCLSSAGSAILEVREAGNWVVVARSPVHQDYWLATFRVKDWEASRDREFRVRLEGIADDPAYAHIPIGIIRKEPLSQDRLLLAILSQNQEEGYPHNGLVSALKQQNPDLIFFAGNQVFGRPASFWREKFSPDQARQEYLRQWLLFGWAYSELLCDRPALVLPDARDYFQNKLWGENGRQVETDPFLDPVAAQDSGGFLMPPDFVELVLTTQLSHMPRPGDESADSPVPDSHFWEVNYGGLSLAVVCDRWFRSAPGPLLTEAGIRNGWALNPDFDPRMRAAVREARLLGLAQLDLLEKWADDWSGGVWMKALLSQSLWVSLLTLPEGWVGEEALWQLRPLKPGEYPPDDRPVADFNSGGWPRPARDRVLRILRRALAVHLAGSGGPPAALKYGLESATDAVWAFGPPAVVNPLAGRWMPKPRSRTAGLKPPQATGNFEDAFGNRFSLKVVTNPTEDLKTGPGPGPAGYGLVMFDRETRLITLESLVRPENRPSAEFKSYPGWPVAFSQLENDGRQPVAYLPLFQFKGLTDPVIQVVDEKTREVVYSLRIKGTEFRPPVFRAGSYTICCGEPGTAHWKELKGIGSLPASVRRTRLVDFSLGPGK